MPLPGQRLFLGGMSWLCMSTNALRSRADFVRLGSRICERIFSDRCCRASDRFSFVVRVLRDGESADRTLRRASLVGIWDTLFETSRDGCAADR